MEVKLTALGRFEVWGWEGVGGLRGGERGMGEREMMNGEWGLSCEL